MEKLIQKILTEWSYRVHDGMPDINNPMHLVNLEDTLNELRLPKEVSQKLLQNLRQTKEDDLVKNKKSGNVYGVNKHNPDTQDLVKKDASDSEIEKAEKGEDIPNDDKKTTPVSDEKPKKRLVGNK